MSTVLRRLPSNPMYRTFVRAAASTQSASSLCPRVAMTRKVVPPVVQRSDGGGDVTGEHGGAPKTFRTGEFRPVLDDRDVEIEELRLPRDGRRDMPASGDDQPRPARHRLDEQIVVVVKRHDSRRAMPELLAREVGRASVDRGGRRRSPTSGPAPRRKCGRRRTNSGASRRRRVATAMGSPPAAAFRQATHHVGAGRKRLGAPFG